MTFRNSFLLVQLYPEDISGQDRGTVQSLFGKIWSWSQSIVGTGFSCGTGQFGHSQGPVKFKGIFIHPHRVFFVTNIHCDNLELIGIFLIELIQLFISISKIC